MIRRVTRRGILGAAAGAGALTLAGCGGPDSPADPTDPPSVPHDGDPTAGESEPGGDVPDEVATHDPADRILPRTALHLVEGGSAVAALGAGEIVVFNTATGVVSSRIPVDVPTNHTTLAWALAGTTAVVPSDGAALALLVDVASGSEPREVGAGADTTSTFSEVALSPDASLAVLAAGADELLVISTADGSEVGRITPEGATGTRIRMLFTAAGELVLSSSADQCPVQIWDAAGAELVRVVDDIPTEPRHYHLQFSQAGTCFLLRETDVQGTFVAEFRNSTTFAETASFPLPVSGTVFSFAPDGSHVAWTAGFGRTEEAAVIHLLDAATGEVTQLVGHETVPGALLHSADSATLYSASSTEGILAWDVATATLTRNFELP